MNFTSIQRVDKPIDALADEEIRKVNLSGTDSSTYVDTVEGVPDENKQKRLQTAVCSRFV